jgi:hypothetical protein
MLYSDLVDHYNSICYKNHELEAQRNKAIEKANDTIASKGCLEIELAGLRQELKRAYQEISDLKYAKS